MKRQKLVALILIVGIILAFATPAFAAEQAFIINGKTITASSYNNATSKNPSCSSYASGIIHAIYDPNYPSNQTVFNNEYNILRNYSSADRKITEDHVKTFIQQISVGSRIRITHYDSTTIDNYDNNSNGHTMVLVAKDNAAGTFTTLEAGSGAGYVVTYTYSSFVNNWTKHNGIGYNYFFYIDDFGITQAKNKASTLKFNISSGEYPSETIEQGTSFPLGGTVTSNYMITTVRGSIINAKDGSTFSAGYQTASTKKFQIQNSKLNLQLKTEDLIPGTYYLQYTAVDKSGKTTTWKSPNFTVAAPKGATYNVTFDPNYTGAVLYGQIVTKGAAYGELPIISRSGYTFDGWFTSTTGGTQIKEDTIANISSDITLYAHWTEQVSRVTRTTQLNLRGAGTSKNEAEGWSWNSETRTLILDNVNFVVAGEPNALRLDSATIILRGNNTITSTYNKNNSTITSGIMMDGDLIFEGSGSLVVTGGSSNGQSCGICSSTVSPSSRVTINGGSITAIGGNSRSWGSYGINAFGLTINGGSLTAIAGKANSNSIGIGIQMGAFNVNGGYIKATSNSASKPSLEYSEAAIVATDGGKINIGTNLTITTPSNSSIAEVNTRNRAFAVLSSPSKPAKEVIIQAKS